MPHRQRRKGMLLEEFRKWKDYASFVALLAYCYDELWDKLMAYVNWDFLGDVDKERLVSEAMDDTLGAARNGKIPEPREQNPMGFLYGIAVRKLIDAVRRSKFEEDPQIVRDLSRIADMSTTEGLSRMDGLVDAFTRCRDNFPSMKRKIIAALEKFDGEASSKELAEECGSASDNAVNQHLSQMRDEILAEYQRGKGTQQDDDSVHSKNQNATS